MTLQAQELRIGNWYNHLGGAGNIKLESDWISYFAKYIELLEGIPLTEDWLIKFGFDKFECYDFGISLKLVPRYQKDDFSILLSGSEFWYTTRQYDGGTSDPFEPVIQVHSVHQLQNIFYCLTGQELTLSTPQR